MTIGRKSRSIRTTFNSDRPWDKKKLVYKISPKYLKNCGLYIEEQNRRMHREVLYVGIWL